MKYLTYVLIGIAIQIMYSLIRRENNRVKRYESNEVFEIRLPKAYLWVGVISTLIFTGMFIYTVVAPNETATVFAGVGFSVFLVLGLSMISACYKWNILLYKDHIVYTTFLGRSYRYDYSQIKRLKIAQSVLILKTVNKTFFIDRYAIGLDMLLRAFKENNIEIK